LNKYGEVTSLAITWQNWFIEILTVLEILKITGVDWLKIFP
jgi:hypothetical protein